MVYNGYYKVMSNIPKMGQLPSPVIQAISSPFEVNNGEFLAAKIVIQ